MNIKLVSAIVAASGLLAIGARAQTQVATPSTPAPAVAAPAATASTRVVYTPRLPSANELMNVAAAQGLTVDRLDQTDSRIVATYHSADGVQSVVTYQILPAAGTPTPANVTTGTTVVTATPAPTVVYTQTQPSTVYYYDNPYPYYYPYSYPWGYYSPVSLSVGWGFGYRGHWGGYHGGFHGHGHR